MWQYAIWGLWVQNPGLCLAAGVCSSPLECTLICPAHSYWSNPIGHVFQPTCPHPSLPMLLSLSTRDKQGISPWPAACPRHAGSSLLPKSSYSSHQTARLGLSGSEAIRVAEALLLDPRHPARKIGTGLPALWRRSLHNPLALASVSPHITKPLNLQDSFGSLLNIWQVSRLGLSSHFSPGRELPAPGSS